MENNYYTKYLKYKSKYIELQKQLGGAKDKCYGLSKFKCALTSRCHWDKPGSNECYSKEECANINKNILTKLELDLSNNNFKDLVKYNNDSTNEIKVMHSDNLSKIIEKLFRENLLSDNIKEKIINKATEIFKNYSIEDIKITFDRYDNLRKFLIEFKDTEYLVKIFNEYIINHKPLLIKFKDIWLKLFYGEPTWKEHREEKPHHSIYITFLTIINAINDIINDIKETQGDKYSCIHKSCGEYKSSISCLGAPGCKNDYHHSDYGWLGCINE